MTQDAPIDPEVDRLIIEARTAEATAYDCIQAAKATPDGSPEHEALATANEAARLKWLALASAIIARHGEGTVRVEDS